MILASNDSGVIGRFQDPEELEDFLASKNGIKIPIDGLSWVPVEDADREMLARIDQQRRLLAAEGALDEGPRRISFANETLKRRAKIEARKARQRKELGESVDPNNLDTVPEEFLLKVGGKVAEANRPNTSRELRRTQRQRQRDTGSVYVEEVKPDSESQKETPGKKSKSKKAPVDLEEVAAELRDLAANPEGDSLNDWAKELAMKSGFSKGAFQIALGEEKKTTKENKLELAKRLVAAYNADQE